MKKLLGILLALTMLFTMGVPAMAEGETALELDYAALTRNSILTVASVDATLLDNLNLPTVGANGSTIAWASSDSSVISNTGVVTRPDFTKSVNLTATLSDGATEMKKVFAFRVPGKNDVIESAHPMPAKGKLIRMDDFNDNSIASSTIETAGTVAEENGKLHLSGAKDVATSAKIYLKEDKSAVTGEFIVEYTLYKNSIYGGMWIQNLSSKGSDYGYIYSYNYEFNDKNSLRLRGANEGSGIWSDFPYTQFGAPSTTLKFTILFDTNNGTYETWINNRYAVKRTRMSSGATDLGYVNFANLSGLLTDYCIDDFACYEVKKDEVGRVVADEKFDGSTIPSRFDKGTATASVESGVLKLSSNGGTSSIYLNDGKAPMVGKFAVSFSFKRTSTSPTQTLTFKDAKGGDAAIIRSWNDGNGVTYNASKNKGEAYAGSNYSTLISGRTDALDVYAEFDTIAQTIKVTVNGKTGEGYLINGRSSIRYILIETSSGASSLEIDNFKVVSLEDGIENITEHYADSFSDGVTDANFEKSTNATWTEANGSMKIASGWIKKVFTNPITEEFTAELSFEGTNTAGVHCYFNGDNGYFGRVTWATTGAVYVYNGKDTVTVNSVGTSALHIKAVFDVANDKFSVWINGIPAGTDLACKNDSPSIKNIQIETGDATGINLDEILFYSIKEEIPATVSELSIDYNAFDKKVTVLSPDAGSALAIAASYMGDVMIDAKLVPVTLAENGSAIADTSELITNGADKVRVYLWNGTSTLVPMCVPKDVTGVISTH